jgi:(S)-mandelate dehydrogenase
MLYGMSIICRTRRSTLRVDFRPCGPWPEKLPVLEVPSSAVPMPRARAANIAVIVVTVDLPVPAKRERDVRNRLTLPLRPSLKMAWNVATHAS